MLTSRGIKVWPGRTARDVPRGRVPLPVPRRGRTAAWPPGDIVALLSRIAGAGLDFVKTENLSDFDGERGYSLGQGE